MSQPTALVIDDEPVTLKMIESLLINAGHSVDTATNGQEGVKRALAAQPDMIITDMRMPKMDGIELCKMLRQARFANRIYIIMLTGSESDELLIASLEAGANDFLVKPIQPKVLEARVRNGLRLIEQQLVIERDWETIRKYAADLSTANRRLEELLRARARMRRIMRKIRHHPSQQTIRECAIQNSKAIGASSWRSANRTGNSSGNRHTPNSPPVASTIGPSRESAQRPLSMATGFTIFPTAPKSSVSIPTAFWTATLAAPSGTCTVATYM